MQPQRGYVVERPQQPQQPQQQQQQQPQPQPQPLLLHPAQLLSYYQQQQQQQQQQAVKTQRMPSQDFSYYSPSVPTPTTAPSSSSSAPPSTSSSSHSAPEFLAETELQHQLQQLQQLHQQQQQQLRAVTRNPSPSVSNYYPTGVPPQQQSQLGYRSLELRHSATTSFYPTEEAHPSVSSTEIFFQGPTTEEPLLHLPTPSLPLAQHHPQEYWNPDFMPTSWVHSISNASGYVEMTPYARPTITQPVEPRAWSTSEDRPLTTPHQATSRPKIKVKKPKDGSTLSKEEKSKTSTVGVSKTRLACDECAKTKVRCVNDGGETCKRCKKKGLVCNFSLTKKRGPKGTPKPSVSEVSSLPTEGKRRKVEVPLKKVHLSTIVPCLMEYLKLFEVSDETHLLGGIPLPHPSTRSINQELLVNSILIDADIDTYCLDVLEKQYGLYVDLAMGSLLRGHPTRSQEFLRLAQRCQAKVGDGASKEIARAHSKMMRYYLYSGELDQAREYNFLSRESCKKMRLGLLDPITFSCFLEQFYFLPQNKKLPFLKVMESIKHESPAHQARSLLLRVMFEYFENLSLVSVVDPSELKRRGYRLLADLSRGEEIYKNFSYPGMSSRAKEPIFLAVYGIRAGIYSSLFDDDSVAFSWSNLIVEKLRKWIPEELSYCAAYGLQFAARVFSKTKRWDTLLLAKQLFVTMKDRFQILTSDVQNITDIMNQAQPTFDSLSSVLSSTTSTSTSPPSCSSRTSISPTTGTSAISKISIRSDELPTTSSSISSSSSSTLGNQSHSFQNRENPEDILLIPTTPDEQWTASSFPPPAPPPASGSTVDAWLSSASVWEPEGEESGGRRSSSSTTTTTTIATNTTTTTLTTSSSWHSSSASSQTFEHKNLIPMWIQSHGKAGYGVPSPSPSPSPSQSPSSTSSSVSASVSPEVVSSTPPLLPLPPPLSLHPLSSTSSEDSPPFLERYPLNEDDDGDDYDTEASNSTLDEFIAKVFSRQSSSPSYSSHSSSEEEPFFDLTEEN